MQELIVCYYCESVTHSIQFKQTRPKTHLRVSRAQTHDVCKLAGNYTETYVIAVSRMFKLLVLRSVSDKKASGVYFIRENHKKSFLSVVLSRIYNLFVSQNTKIINFFISPPPRYSAVSLFITVINRAVTSDAS